MTKHQRKALHQQVRELFARHNVTITEDLPERPGERAGRPCCPLGSAIHGTMPSPYGPIDVTFYNATDHRGHPWLACRLTAWAGSYPQHWYGWDHWKQNIQGFTGTPAAFVGAVGRHLWHFSLDQGDGFPAPAEIAATLAADRERAARMLAACDEMLDNTPTTPAP